MMRWRRRPIHHRFIFREYSVLCVDSLLVIGLNSNLSGHVHILADFTYVHTAFLHAFDHVKGFDIHISKQSGSIGVPFD